jgi:uroporphyrinogen decarboxylase
MITRHTVEQLEALLGEIGPYIDIYFLNGDDWGTQDQLIMPPRIYESLFMPYHRRMNDAIHAAARRVKTFLHSCGAIYDIIDLIFESGFDVLNPIQWTAGGLSFREWKDKCRNRVAMWGGGIDSQNMLPYGTPEGVVRQVTEIVSYLVANSGYVFCSVQNMVAGVPAENIVAMYRAASGNLP